MKKMIFGMAFVAATIFATATANAAPMRAADDTKTEQCCKDKKQCDRKDDGKDKRGHHDHDGRKGHGKKPDMFAGITLTPEQQTKIDALRSDMMARKEAAKAAAKAAGKAGRTDEDKAKAKAERQAAMAQYDAQIKQILTPEQYKVFEQNCEAAKAKMKSRMDKVQTAKLSKKVMRDTDPKIKLPVNPKAIYPKTANS